MISFLNAGLRIEEGTAKFYLDVADGNLKEAIALYGEYHFKLTAHSLCDLAEQVGMFDITLQGCTKQHCIKQQLFACYASRLCAVAEQDMAWEQKNKHRLS